MHSLEIEYLVMQQQHEDRLRNIEREHLIQVARQQNGIDSKSYQRASQWLGKQMIKWGEKLQSYDPPSPSEAYTLKT